jgi:hypothetical protein
MEHQIMEKFLSNALLVILLIFLLSMAGCVGWFINKVIESI